MQPAGEQEILVAEPGLGDPCIDRLARGFGDLELHRPAGLLLHHRGTAGPAVAVGNVRDTQFDQIACTQLAVDGKIEQGEFSRAMRQMQRMRIPQISRSFRGAF